MSGRASSTATPLREVTDRFHMGRAPSGALAGPLPVAHGLLRQARLGVVVRQQLGLRLGEVGKALGHHLRRALVVLLPGAPQQRLIGRILHQGMLERIGGLRRHAPLVEHLGLHQLPQATPERQLVHGRHGPQQLIGKRPPQHRPELRHRLTRR